MNTKINDNSIPAQVTLLGAGPGDPELITVRGLKRLKAAEVLIYDDLAGSELPNEVPAGCEKIYVGKRAGKHSRPQGEINALILEHARRGKRVVRLKGGDVFVFGRGGEEIEALAGAGISFEVVPGITAALAAGAAAHIPLTHRDLASSLVFITGHEAVRPGDPGVPWEQYAKLRATLCVYMGAVRLPIIAGRLLAGGLAHGTPAAAVIRAGRPDMKVVPFDLGRAAAGELSGEVVSPAIVVIGDVARFACAAQAFAGVN